MRTTTDGRSSATPGAAAPWNEINDQRRCAGRADQLAAHPVLHAGEERALEHELAARHAHARWTQAGLLRERAACILGARQVLTGEHDLVGIGVVLRPGAARLELRALRGVHRALQQLRG